MPKRTSEGLKTSMESPGNGIFVIAPDDANDLPHDCRGLLVTASGTIVVNSVDGLNGDGVGVSIPVLAGQMIRCRIKRVHATGTNIPAGNIFGLT